MEVAPEVLVQRARLPFRGQYSLPAQVSGLVGHPLASVMMGAGNHQ